MITTEERRDVQDELEVVLAGQMDQRAFLTTIFGAESTDLLRVLPTTLRTADQYATFAIDYCLASRWSLSPSLMDLLLDYLIQRKGIGRLGVLLERVRRQEDPNGNPYDALWLVTELPFFDRTVLRGHIRSLIEGNARAVLKVTPQPDSYGRTYSRKFLEHLEDVFPDDTHVLYEPLAPGTAPSYHAQDLATSFAAQLGVTESFAADTTSSVSKAVALRLLGHVMSRSGRWIIVLDGFGQSGLQQEVRETIEAIAGLIPTGQYRRRVRLVLLDYPHALPNVSSADVLEEVLSSADSLTRADLEPCIVEWDAKRREAGCKGIPPREIFKLAEGMIQRAPATGKARLESFNDDLSKLLQFPEN
jgi:hypothetical protein